MDILLNIQVPLITKFYTLFLIPSWYAQYTRCFTSEIFLFFKSPPRLRLHLPDAVGLLASCAVILSPSEFLRTELRLEISHPCGWLEVAQEGVVPSVHSSVSAPVVEHFGVGRCWVATAEVVQLKGNLIIVYIHGKRQKKNAFTLLQNHKFQLHSFLLISLITSSYEFKSSDKLEMVQNT